MKYALIFLITPFISSVITLSAFSADYDNPMELTAIKGILQDFTYQLKPVHPGCVKEFDVSLADSLPPIVRSVDVRACVSSNELAVPYDTGEDGYVRYEYELDGGGKGSFGYKYIGKSDSGVFVLATRSSTGGTIVAESVFLIKDSFENYWAFDNDDKKTQDRRLVITCIGQIILGDRDSGSLKLEGDKLTLGASQYRKKEAAIDLGKFNGD